MRELKFRAFHKGINKYTNGSMANMFQWIDDGQPIILEQFTGLQDKNGKDIYEGDVFLVPIAIEVEKGNNFNYFNTDKQGNRTRINSLPKPCVIEKHKSLYVFVHKSGKTKPFWVCEHDIEHKYELVGNIHVKPELIK